MNEQMIEAAIKAMREEERENSNLKLGKNADVYDLATLTLAAAEPLIRAQVIQEIREAAGRDDVVEAFYQTEVKAGPKGATVQEHVLAMLDQIERTQKP